MSDEAGTTPQVGAYMRVSTMLQKRRGSIETQRPDIERYLSAYDLAPYAWYEDEAVSGHWVPFGERPQGKRLLADAKAGHVSLVLVWRLDRFGRNAVEILKAVEELEQAGARLVSLKESFDTRTAGGRLMLTVLAALSEYEWESIKERSEAGVARKLDGGGWMGGQAPYGYKVEGERPHSHLILDDIEPLITLPSSAVMTAAEIVRMMYGLLVDEGLSTIKIADRLNDLGVPTSFVRKARRFHRGEVDTVPMAIWRANAVNDIISNPANKGEYTFGRRRNRNARNGHSAPREIATVQIPALVSIETWNAAQAVLERNMIWSPRNAKHDYLLRGLITCGLCSHGFIGDSRGDKNGTPQPLRYACIARRHPRALYGNGAYAEERRCTAPYIRADELEADIWADVEQALLNPGPVLNSLAVQLSGTADQASELRAKVAKKQQEQSEKQAEKDSVLALFRKGRIDERDLNRQLDDIAREETEITKDIQALMKQLASAEEIAGKLAGAETLLQELRDTLDSEPPSNALKRRIIERLVSSIVVDVVPDPDGEEGEVRAEVRVTYTFSPPDGIGITANMGERGHSHDRD